MQAFSDLDVCRSSEVCICYKSFNERLKDGDHNEMMGVLPSATPGKDI